MPTGFAFAGAKVQRKNEIQAIIAEKYCYSIIFFYLQRLDEGSRNLERVVGDGVPEVVVLRGVGVAQGDVADDAERDERHLVNIARLGNGARLHIDSTGLREVADDLAHLLLRVDEPVARHDQTRVNA